MVPTDRKYTREHDWVLIEDGVATLGITDHAQSELGDIVYVELPEVDSEINLGESYTTVESVKAASPVNSRCRHRHRSQRRAGRTARAS